MSFMNLNFQLLIFRDVQPNGGKPNVRTPDISESFQGLQLNNVVTSDPTLQPGETRTIVDTTRSLAAGATTEWSIQRPIATQDFIRLYWDGTGTNPLIRTNRALATDATTAITISRLGPSVARMTATAGTPITTTSVQVGDIIQIGKNTDVFQSPFGSQNIGTTWVVQNVGTGYVDFIDNGNAGLDQGIVLGASFAVALAIFSPGPVLIGDTLHLEGAGLNGNNYGDYEITDVSWNYVEFVNPYATVQTFVNTAEKVVVYDYLIEFMYLQAKTLVSLSINGNPAETLGQLGPSIQAPSIKLGTTRAYTMSVTNEGTEPACVLLTTAGVDH